MKSSTLHRSCLTKERMSMLENVKFQAAEPSELNQYTRVSRSSELDVLYRSLEKSTPEPADTKPKQKMPTIFLSIGFMGAAVFFLVVALVVWASSLPSKKPLLEDVPKNEGNIEVLSDTKEIQEAARQEKYILKSGDTLEKIAVRFYGRYDVAKIEEIKKINNITHPERLQIGQVVIVPLGK